ncbi:alpha/beta hydrolase-fold protein [Agromyces atrinae]|uniref:alpha/beta hydrolase family protein n=1 Tax=Agromyces atrinae TaxID=592376 RepID=UPI001F55CDA8|nr:alpha/beta hydrolase [Agromyces atrinae]MCI2959562.1 alpha/beta hydrolase-fold protein [Agromyces atrinae]
MPTTPNGTVWTKRTATIDGVGETTFSCPDAKLSDPATPAVLFFHGAGGTSDQMVALPAFNGMRDMLLDEGLAIIEGDPLPIPFFGTGELRPGQQWCNAQSRAAYPAFHQYWAARHSAANEVRFLFGRSMGGLLALYLAAKHPSYADAAVISNSGVSTWRVGNNTPPVGSVPPVAERSTSRHFTKEVLFGAWGVSDFASLDAALADADVLPELWPEGVFAGREVAFQYGTADTTAPWFPRGGEAVLERWSSSLGALSRVDRLEGGMHGGSPSSYQQVPEVRAFVREVLGEAPIPPAPTVYHRVIAHATAIGGKLHRLT